IIDPNTTYIYDNVRIGQDTIIRPCTVIENNVTIGTQCVIGPFARIRPGTKIGNRVEIGNFAEVSRSVMGERCFMKHFSFLGDARVGRDVNIGAGVVTANYDGKHKNQTRVGARAFVGSDSILVAPVEIGPDAMTAAGCVVIRGTKVPSGSVIMGVPGRIRKKKE
ncbi:MAG: DapH/DapD/GlmU-related protein, partial [Candidatus Omnitrophota bacterium]